MSKVTLLGRKGAVLSVMLPCRLQRQPWGKFCQPCLTDGETKAAGNHIPSRESRFVALGTFFVCGQLKAEAGSAGTLSRRRNLRPHPGDRVAAWGGGGSMKPGTRHPQPWAPAGGRLRTAPSAPCPFQPHSCHWCCCPTSLFPAAPPLPVA